MGRGRGLNRVLCGFLGVLLMLPVIAGLSTIPAGAQDEAPLDLPAMALFPDDLAAAGLDDYVIGVGNQTPTFNESLWLALHNELDLDEVEQAFADAGTEQVYTMFLDLRADPEDPESELLGSVVSYVYPGDDEAGAEGLFEIIADGAANSAGDELTAETVGDTSQMTVHEGTEPYLLQEATWLALHMQANTDVLGVVLVDYTSGTLDEDIAVELGARLVDRVDDVRDGDSPGLAPLALQLVPGDEIAAPGPFYTAIDGEALPVAAEGSGLGKYAETVGDDAERAVFYDEIGADDVLFSQQALRGGTQGGRQDYYLEIVLLRFTDEAAADEYLASAEDRLAGDRAIEELEQRDDAPSSGDEAVAFAYQQENADGVLYYHYPTFIRVADIVVRIDPMGIAPMADGVDVVAEAQAECLVAGDCSEQIEVPADFQAD